MSFFSRLCLSFRKTTTIPQLHAILKQNLLYILFIVLINRHGNYLRLLLQKEFFQNSLLYTSIYRPLYRILQRYAFQIVSHFIHKCCIIRKRFTLGHQFFIMTMININYTDCQFHTSFTALFKCIRQFLDKLFFLFFQSVIKNNILRCRNPNLSADT